MASDKEVHKESSAVVKRIDHILLIQKINDGYLSSKLKISAYQVPSNTKNMQTLRAKVSFPEMLILIIILYIMYHLPF